MEKEPRFKVRFGEEEFEATRDNTSLFRFFGQLAIYNHVFIIKDKEKGEVSYIFDTHPAYDKVTDFMIEKDYPIHMNLREIAKCDSDAYDMMLHEQMSDELEDGVPEDWS